MANQKLNARSATLLHRRRERHRKTQNALAETLRNPHALGLPPRARASPCARASNLRWGASPWAAERSKMGAHIAVDPQASQVARRRRHRQASSAEYRRTPLTQPVWEASAYRDVLHPMCLFSFSTSSAWIRTLHFNASKVVGLLAGLDPFPGGNTGGQPLT